MKNKKMVWKHKCEKCWHVYGPNGFWPEGDDFTKTGRLSAVTEQVLKALTYEPVGYSNDHVVEAYDKLFKSMLPILDKYGTTVTVGCHTGAEYADRGCVGYIYLDNHGKLSICLESDDNDADPSISITEALPFLYDPPRI
jgi:hypothetical protein